MTVIAWDGKTLATDSRETSGGTVTTDNNVKIKTIDVHYLGERLLAIGFSGKSSACTVLLENLSFPLEKGLEMSALIIGEHHLYELECGSIYPTQYNKKEHRAIGSGWVLAFSGMMLGLTAEESVKHAIKYNISCGGTVRKWEEKV